MPNPAFLASNPSFVLALGAIGLIVLAWVVRWPRLAVALLPLSLVAGQIIRLPLPGQGGGWLASDIAVIVVLLAVTVRVILWGGHAGHLNGFKEDARFRGNDLALLFLPFILWSLWSLVIHFSSLGTPNFLVAFAYWARLAAYLLSLPALVLLCKDSKNLKTLKMSFIVSISLLVIGGFLQLLLLPRLAIIGNGWDPHEGRLVSTWLDPNFFGAFLGMSSFWLLTMLSGIKRDHRFWFVLLIISTLAALLLTRSRSSLVAYFITLIAVLPFIIIRWRRQQIALPVLLSIASVSLISVFLGTLLLGDRALGLLQGDATVATRAAALARVLSLASDHYLVGVGYNAYQFAAQKAGLISDFSIHSRGGADNSLLTIWVTTGLTGVLLFFTPWLVTGGYFLRRWLLEENALALAAASSLLFLFIHSQFINSFLYPHLLITLIILLVGVKATNRNQGKL